MILYASNLLCTGRPNLTPITGKGNVFYGQGPQREESTINVCVVNYQLHK